MVDAGNEALQQRHKEELAPGQQGEQVEDGQEEGLDVEMVIPDGATLLPSPSAGADPAGALPLSEERTGRKEHKERSGSPTPHAQAHRSGDSTEQSIQYQADASPHAGPSNKVNGAGHVDRMASRFARPFYPKKWHAQRIDQEEQSSLNGAQDGGLPMDQSAHSTSPRALPDFVPRYQLRGHRKTISCVRISPDGELLATAGRSTSALN